MSEFFHGVRARKQSTALSTVSVSSSGIPFVVGCAPVHLVGGKTNEPILCNNYDEAAAALGYSDDWAKYDLCEVMYSHFKRYGMGPVVFVNVFDPAKANKPVAETAYPIVDGQISLGLDVIKDTVKVKGDAGTEYSLGVDYDLFYGSDGLVVEILEGGAIGEAVTELSISYSEADLSLITKEDIIGGFDPETKLRSGFELISQVYPRFLVVPDLLLAPNWSSDPEVAAVMAAKSEKIDGVFSAIALIDADCTNVTYYTDVSAWAEENGMTSENQVVMWPMEKDGDRIYHASVRAAGLAARLALSEGGCPCDYWSNKTLDISATVLANGEEVVIDNSAANYLNSHGICTAINTGKGFVFWGNYTACYPTDKAPENCFIAVKRMFGWVGNSVVLSYWGKVDEKMNRRLVDSIIDSINIWLNGLVADNKLLGGRVEFPDEDNPIEDLINGIMNFRLYMTPPSPAQEININLHYDASYVGASFTA